MGGQLFDDLMAISSEASLNDLKWSLLTVNDPWLPPAPHVKIDWQQSLPDDGNMTNVLFL